jgi:hypothetical protein
MQIRIIIEHKYSSSHQKSAAIVRKEKEFFVSIFANQERNTKISRTHPRLRVIGRINTYGQGINKIFEQEKKRGGSAVIRKKRRELKIENLILTG